MQAVSLILHPLLMPSILFAILFYFSPLVIQPLPQTDKPLFLLIIAITTFIIPLISIVMLKITGTISSYEMSHRRERIVPFSFITVFFGITTYLFLSKFSLDAVFYVILISISCSILLVTITTMFWKVSAHSVGIMGTIGIIVAINYKFPGNALLVPMVLMVLAAGLVMSARLYLNSHKPNEVFVGGLGGFVVNYLAIMAFA